MKLLKNNHMTLEYLVEMLYYMYLSESCFMKYISRSNVPLVSEKSPL